MSVTEINTPLPLNREDKRDLFDWPNEAGFTAAQEQHEPKRLSISGKFPTYTAGSLYRIGPGTYRAGNFEASHWFDGFTHLHKFNLLLDATGDVEVEYTSRSQVDKLLEQARTTGKLDNISFGQKRDPCDSYFKKLKSSFRSANYKVATPTLENIGVVVYKTPGKQSSNSLTVSTDSSGLKEFHPDLLEPFGVINQKALHPELRGQISGAHPGIDPQTGDVFNFNLELGPQPTYRVFKTSYSTGKTEILAKFSDKDIQPAYVHSIFITENYVVLCIWPAFFKNYGLNILWEKNILDALRFDPSAQTNWLVVDRRNGQGIVNRFTSDAIFAFHFVNGWEEQNEQGATDIICDLVEHEDMTILHKFYYENLVSNAPAAREWTRAAKPTLEFRMTRYRLPGITSKKASSATPLKTPHPAQVLTSVPAPHCGELPRINESLITKRHQYVYGVAMRDLSSFYDCLVKTDMNGANPSSSSLLWECPKHSPGEPIFVPDPEGKNEDDGVLLSVVLNGESGTSYLLCLDARSMKEIARAEVDAAVGFGFHGIHLPNAVS